MFGDLLTSRMSRNGRLFQETDNREETLASRNPQNDEQIDNNHYYTTVLPEYAVRKGPFRP